METKFLGYSTKPLENILEMYNDGALPLIKTTETIEQIKNHIQKVANGIGTALYIYILIFTNHNNEISNNLTTQQKRVIKTKMEKLIKYKEKIDAEKNIIEQQKILEDIYPLIQEIEKILLKNTPQNISSNTNKQLN